MSSIKYTDDNGLLYLIQKIKTLLGNKVDKETGCVLNEVEYMAADTEDEYIVAQANEPLDENGCLAAPRITCRVRDEIVEVPRERVDYIDVSPKMMVSVATAMIPFLENDDANRALMGSNMQRQAVPLLVTEAPVVGTGMEYKAACDSGVVVLAKNSGTVELVDAESIVIRRDDNNEKDEYTLLKFRRSNQGTCINQRPIVSHGEHIEAGEVIADGTVQKIIEKYNIKNGEVSISIKVIRGEYAKILADEKQVN